ncbi:putative 26S proteasome regulatory subunit [Malassezia sp. CBS 17886]|nr:putative 26S proteasome regulatory subunit [Malassezia sp. CBS 17886]
MEFQARSDALRLQQQRKALDGELAAQYEALEQCGATMTSALLDPHGFPLAGIDIAAIRAARHRIHCLARDRAQVTEQIAALLTQAIPGGARGDAATANGAPATHAGAASARDRLDAGAAVPRPVAVRSVAPGSPAASAGVLAGDVVASVADIAPLTTAQLGMLPARIREGEDVPIVVRRRAADGYTADVPLTLVPSSAWGGRGLLGCHFVPA